MCVCCMSVFFCGSLCALCVSGWVACVGRLCMWLGGVWLGRVCGWVVCVGRLCVWLGSVCGYVVCVIGSCVWLSSVCG